MGVALYVADMASGFGDWLEQRLDDIPITQAELSRRSNVSEGQLSRYRHGQTIPDPGTLRALAPHLNASFEEMMVLAGHSPGDAHKAGRTFIVSTDNPKVHRLYKVVSEASDASADDVARAEEILRALFRKKNR